MLARLVLLALFSLGVVPTMNASSSPFESIFVQVRADLPRAVSAERAALALKIAPELLAAYYADADAIVEPVRGSIVLEFRDVTVAQALVAVARIPGLVAREVIEVSRPLRLEDWVVYTDGAFVPPPNVEVLRRSVHGRYVRVRTFVEGSARRVVDRRGRPLPSKPVWDAIWPLAASETYVEANALFRGTAATSPPPSKPNDPDYQDTLKRWHLDHSGAPTAWKRSTDCNVVVAVIDSGIDLDHPDLTKNLWVNLNEVPGNGLDDDGNGYEDDIHGWDFWSKDADPDDDHDHGTHLAGVIGAVGDNGKGIVGMCWSVQLMPVRIYPNLLKTVGGDVIADAVRYAVDSKATILNCSFGGKTHSKALEDAFLYAASKNVLAVTSAGNGSGSGGVPIDSIPYYPPWFKSDNIVTVASITGTKWALFGGEGLTTTSNFGKQRVHLAAPGRKVWTTGTGGDYEWANGGTSIAAAVGSGAAALLWYEAGGAYKDVIACLKQTATARPYLQTACSTGASVNVSSGCVGPVVAEPVELPNPPVVDIPLPPIQGPITRIVGVLEVGVFAAGGETTGTLLRLEDGSIELDCSTVELSEAAASLAGRRVEVSGELVTVSGPERGDRRVLRVRELQPE